MSKLKPREKKRIRITVDIPSDVAAKLDSLKTRAARLGFAVSLSADLVNSIRQHLKGLDAELKALEKKTGERGGN
ncbi:hypothetical protein [Geomonas oryzae]|uniref:hypothetical protein n=1 Tax=Geomonas oryzae TaxID=2364273 RepID=UPI00100B89A9|nr:hypothetical protein [Geomonas oryzae]